MAKKLKGKALIGQSGGPTAVINQSLVGAIEEARKHAEITHFLGARHGTKGIMKENFVDLFKVPRSKLALLAGTPAAALGSVRHKPSPADCRKIFRICRKYGVRYYFYIGGDDSAKSAYMINRIATRAKYPMRVYHIPKTIDNNLVKSDHSPGFGSAARFVASAVLGDDLDNRSLPGIKIDVIMGRDAGWLTAASVLAREKKGQGPHLIYLPEVPFTVKKFVADVRQAYAKYGRCVICVSEGIRHPNKKLWGEIVGRQLARGLKDKAKNIFGKPVPDPYGHFQLSGTGILADFLAGRIKQGLRHIKGLRVRADTFGYLQRSFAGYTSKVDAAEARQVGREAVKAAITRGGSGSIAIKRRSNKPYEACYKVVALKKVAGKNQVVPAKFICPGGNDIRPSFRNYCLPLVGGLPKTGRLE